MARTSTKTTRGRKPKASKSTSASTRRPTPARSSPAPWKVGKSEVGVRIRMYRVGFGDFFLLTFLGDDEQPQHVIVDCGVFKGTAVLDLDYAEDSEADTDANFVMTGSGNIVEIQATAEKDPFSEEQLLALLALARMGIEKLVGLQKLAVA